MPSISFNLGIITKKSFDVFLKGFTPSDSWFILMTNKMSLSFVMKLSKAFTITMTNKLNVAYSFKLQQFLTWSFFAGRHTMNWGMKFKEYISNTLSQISSLNIYFRSNERVTTAISNFSFSSDFTPILATFFSLGDWDASTLGTLDSDTLGDLDYTAV